MVPGYTQEWVRKLRNDYLLGNMMMTLNPCFEYGVDTHPLDPRDPNKGYRRNPMVFPFDLTTLCGPIHLRVDTLMIINDLTDSEKKVYLKIIQLGERILEVGKANAVGIQLATSIPTRQ